MEAKKDCNFCHGSGLLNSDKDLGPCYCTSFPDLPITLGSTWHLPNWSTYIVVDITNRAEGSNQNPDVIYKCEKGHLWSRPLATWHHCMSPLPIGHFWTDRHITTYLGKYMIKDVVDEFDSVNAARLAIVNNPQWGLK